MIEITILLLGLIIGWMTRNRAYRYERKLRQELLTRAILNVESIEVTSAGQQCYRDGMLAGYKNAFKLTNTPRKKKDVIDESMNRDPDSGTLLEITVMSDEGELILTSEIPKNSTINEHLDFIKYSVNRNGDELIKVVKYNNVSKRFDIILYEK